MFLSYTIQSFNVSQFIEEAIASELTSKVIGYKFESPNLIVYISEPITIDEKLVLDNLVSNHIANFIPNIVGKTIVENKAYSDNMMERLKQKNILEGLSSIDQSSWVHHRLRKVPYLLSDNQTLVDIDVLNLVVSGDVETAEQVLSQLQPDDMTKYYHWLTQERINWIRNDIRKYLGWPEI